MTKCQILIHVLDGSQSCCNFKDKLPWLPPSSIKNTVALSYILKLHSPLLINQKIITSLAHNLLVTINFKKLKIYNITIFPLLVCFISIECRLLSLHPNHPLVIRLHMLPYKAAPLFAKSRAVKWAGLTCLSLARLGPRNKRVKRINPFNPRTKFYQPDLFKISPSLKRAGLFIYLFIF